MINQFAILWQPKEGFLKLPELKVSWLIGVFILIEFALSLSILNVFVDGVRKAIAANPTLTPGTMPYVVVISMVFASLINAFVIAVAAVVFLLVALVAGGTTSYRSVVGMLTLASTPLLLSHALRNFCYLTGVTQSVSYSVLPLSLLLPSVDSATINEALRAFDIFDVWSMVLVVLGFSRISGLKPWFSYGAAFAVWGMLQMLLFRIHMAGAAGQ